jgi:ParB family transcriptional regulator, chromosome partitioning protein
MRCNGKHHRFGWELLDVSDAGALSATLKNAGDARAQMITLALVLGAHEADLGMHTWRSRNRAAERYLSQIATWGYDLSETEQSVITDDSDDE